MARRRGVRVTVLGEDDRHRQFGRRVFLRLGYHPREIRLAPSPVGRGAAEKWVRTQYPKEVSVHRRQRSSQEVALLVVLDADRKTVKQRHAQLAKELKENSVQERASNEPIVIWIPRRHIETWIAFVLGDDDVNENDDYKRQVRNRDYRPAVERFVEYYQHPDRRPGDLPASLATGYSELGRLKG